jgi:hypothetical protein
MNRNLSFHFRLFPPNTSNSSLLERVRVWLSKAIALWLLPVFVVTSSCCSQNEIHKIPAIRGRVVEAKTNKPIAGARLVRWFEREDGCLAPGGSDVHRVAGSLLSVTSGEDGSFEWPAWTGLLKPIRSMNWYVYHLGWVAQDGWVTQPRSGLTGYFVGVNGSEPWVHLTSGPVDSHLEVTIAMEPTDSTPSWEADFQRLTVLTRYGVFDVEHFLNEAVSCTEQGKVSEQILGEISEIGGSLGGFRDGQPCYKADLAWRFLKIREQGCMGHFAWGPCSPQGLTNARSFLERNCSNFRE